MSNLCQQFRKHKRKFIYLTGLAGTALAIYKFTKVMQCWNNEYQSTNNIEFKMQKVQYFQAALSNSSQTVKTILKNVENEIESSIDSENIASSLGISFKLPDQLNENKTQHTTLSADSKLELWKKLKVLSFTKLTLLIYSWSFICVTIHIQMSILAGNLFQVKNIRKHSNPFLAYFKTIFPSENQNSIDENFQHGFINFTLKQIQSQIGNWAELIEKTCSRIIVPISLKTVLSSDDIRAILAQIKEAVHNDILEGFLQVVQSQHGIGQIQTSIYGLYSNIFESNGIGQIDRLIDVLSDQVCCQIGTKQHNRLITAESKQPLAKLVPFIWESFRTESSKAALYNKLDKFCAESKFRFLVFNAYENGMNTPVD